MIGLLNTDEVGGLAAVFAFMAVAGLAILYDSARIRAEVARMAGVRRAIEQRLELAGGYKRAGLVWEKIHEGDYGGIPRLIAEVESECVSDPVLTNGLALNRRGRRRHYLRGYLDAANSIGLADALWRPPAESPGP